MLVALSAFRLLCVELWSTYFCTSKSMAAIAVLTAAATAASAAYATHSRSQAFHASSWAPGAASAHRVVAAAICILRLQILRVQLAVPQQDIYHRYRYCVCSSQLRSTVPRPLDMKWRNSVAWPMHTMTLCGLLSSSFRSLPTRTYVENSSCKRWIRTHVHLLQKRVCLPYKHCGEQLLDQRHGSRPGGTLQPLVKQPAA